MNNLRVIVMFVVLIAYHQKTTEGTTIIKDITAKISRNVLFFLSDCTLGANKTRLLFSSRNQNAAEVNLSGPGTIPVDPSLQTVFIAHGFLSDGTKDWINDTIQTLLQDEPRNIFSIDWRVGACSEKIDFLNVQSYSAATVNTEEVGIYVAGCMETLVKRYGVLLKDLWMIGHSLGAHVVGFAGKALQAQRIGRVGRITGLDPAGPLFRTLGSRDRLDKTDAEFVEVVHTSSLFGLQEAIGDVDLYFNGGEFQPSCILRQPGCSHNRAIEYYLEAIRNPKCSFMGRAWSRRSAYKKSVDYCTQSTCVIAGPLAIKSSARGTFRINTNHKEPYCNIEKNQEENQKAENHPETEIASAEYADTDHVDFNTFEEYDLSSDNYSEY